jgi:hypothetical protein
MGVSEIPRATTGGRVISDRGTAPGRHTRDFAARQVFHPSPPAGAAFHFTSIANSSFGKTSLGFIAPIDRRPPASGRDDEVIVSSRSMSRAGDDGRLAFGSDDRAMWGITSRLGIRVRPLEEFGERDYAQNSSTA